jgi:hypothetical protein
MVEEGVLQVGDSAVAVPNPLEMFEQKVWAEVMRFPLSTSQVVSNLLNARHISYRDKYEV